MALPGSTGRRSPTARHLIIYGQRTADGRLAFGGRGAPYHFGSRIRPSYDVEPRVFEDLRGVLRDLLPQLGREGDGVRFTHQWGGCLGITRDWAASVGLDRQTGIGWAGGYVGDGVATTNLAGRTLADLVTGADSDLVSLPWVNHRSRTVGAGTTALAGHQRGAARDDDGRRGRGMDRPAEPDRAADGPRSRAATDHCSGAGPLPAIGPWPHRNRYLSHLGRRAEGTTVIKGERSTDSERREPRLPARRPSRMEIDADSKAIIEQLQQDGRRSYAVIGESLGLSEEAVRKRVAQLVEADVMQIVAVTDPLQLGFARQAMIGVIVEGALKPVAEKLAAIEEVDYVVITAGGFDILAEVVGQSDAHLLELVTSMIRPIPGVVSIHTFLYLELEKQTYTWGVHDPH